MSSVFSNNICERVCFRSLRNNRTRIHKNLFVAMVIQVLIRLTLYIDQALIRSGAELRASSIRHGIDNTVNTTITPLVWKLMCFILNLVSESIVYCFNITQIRVVIVSLVTKLKLSFYSDIEVALNKQYFYPRRHPFTSFHDSPISTCSLYSRVL